RMGCSLSRTFTRSRRDHVSRTRRTSQCVETGAAPPGPRPSVPDRFSLDRRPDPAVALVIGACALGEIALAHLRDVVRGVGEFEQRLEACEVRGKLTLPVVGYFPELLWLPGGDLV